jgi:lysophospholipase L1-like esterase
LIASLLFLALGDSYTIGEGVAVDGRWPAQLAHELRREGIDIAGPQIVATTGWTTDELSAGMDAVSLEARYDLVTLSIGVNNQYRGRSPDEFREQFHALIVRAIALAGADPHRVVVVSIPDWGVTRFAQGRDTAKIASELDAFNAIARDETTRARAHWVDVTPESRKAGSHEGMLAEDGLHPSANQYTLWTGRILPVVRAALGGK